MESKLTKEKVFLDLIKLSKEQRTKIEDVLKYEIEEIEHFPFLIYSFDVWNQFGERSTFLYNRTELTYPEFIKLFEGGETDDTEFYTKEDMEKAYRAGEKGSTYYFKDTTVILPTSYEGVDG